MIRRIVYTNFQKHTKYVLDLDDKVTCLVGPSDAGKSALVRGLYWACLNRPGGDDFLRHGADKVSVKLYTKRHKIERVRGKRTNEYRINGRVLKAFGQSNVPEEIVQVLNVGEDNFRLQLDPHFWFSDTSGQVSQKLNEVVNLSLIDRALEHAATKVRSAKQDLEYATERRDQARKEFESLEWVPRYLRRAEAVEQLKSDHAAKSHRIASIRLLLSQAALLRRRRDRAKEAMLEAEKVAVMGRQAIEAAQKAERIRNLVTEGRKASRLAKLDMSPFARLHRMRTEGDELAEKVRRVEGLVKQGTQLEDELCQLEKERKELEGHMSQIKTCPACGRPVESSPSSPRIFTSAKRRR